MKRIASLLIALFLFCGAMATAEETVETRSDSTGTYEYVLLEDGSAEITGYSGDAEVLEIPPELDGYSVTSIGDNAFYFRNFISVTIPDGVTSIKANPFFACGQLQTIQVSPNHPVLAVVDGVLFEKTTKTLICYPGGLDAAEYAIPEGILSIGDYAFYSCKNLTDITIPDSVTSIGVNAFAYCISLTGIAIPDSVASIGINPFLCCAQLQTIQVSPDHPVLATIDGVLFDKSTKTLICYPTALDTAEYAIPQGILSIGRSALAYCENLTSIAIPDSVTSIGDYAFSGCGNLTSVNIPDGVASISTYAFSGCGNLTSIAIPDSVTSIDEGAFSACHNLTSVNIPDSVTSIGDYAFLSCYALTSVTLPDSVASIGKSAFNNCSDNLALTVGRDSYAKSYAEENGISYTYPDANDWLNS